MNLSPVIALLENGCDQKDAAKELRICQAMQYAVDAGDWTLMNEQAALLRECRAALDSILAQNPMMVSWKCGSTTLGNLRAELYAYRPQAIFSVEKQKV